MPENAQPILPLPVHVAAQIKSSTTIPSFPSIVLGLLTNALDAGSERIDVSIDFAKGSISVEDNGNGIAPEEFTESGGLGKQYHTSKTGKQLSRTYGKNGTFLASVAALSILTITSHHSTCLEHASLVLHHSRPAARLFPAAPYQHLSNREHGTRVVVQDIFGNMPVRVKQRGLEFINGDENKQLELLIRAIVGLLLAWHSPVSVSIKSIRSDRRLFIRSKRDISSSGSWEKRSPRLLDTRLVCGILSQASYIEPTDWVDWIQTSARTPSVSITGVISLQPAPSRKVQYISLGIRPVSSETGSNVLYDEINRLFASSSFGTEDETSDHEEASIRCKRKEKFAKSDGFTSKNTKGSGKGVDRWPMFYIRIGVNESREDSEEPIEDLREDTLSTILKVLGAMVTGFLETNHFRPRARPIPRQMNISSHMNATPKCPLIQDHSKVVKSSHIREDGDPAGSFSMSSRIKQGNYVKTAGLSGFGVPNRARNILIQSDIAELSETETNHPHIPQESQVPCAAVDHASLDQGDEPTVEWTNPVSGATFSVSARTGLVVNSKTSRRPATATPTMGSKSLPSPAVSARIAGVNMYKRLTHNTSRPSTAPKAGSWSNDFLKNWENPIFNLTEGGIRRILPDNLDKVVSDTPLGKSHCCTEADIGAAFAHQSLPLPAKLSKEALRNARIISQVDRKFILLCMAGNQQLNTMSGGQLLVLVDQHAADERVRVESLLGDLKTAPIALAKPLVFDIQSRECELFQCHATHLSSWGIIYDIIISAAGSPHWTMVVKSLPGVIAERCRIEPKLLFQLIRSEVWKREENASQYAKDNANPRLLSDTLSKKENWLSNLGTCPQGLLDMINSRACRSALMFNDELTVEDCQTLIHKLSECTFPFQCAHGRPSLAPLVSLGAIVASETVAEDWMTTNAEVENGGKGFGAAWRSWRNREALTI